MGPFRRNTFLYRSFFFFLVSLILLTSQSFAIDVGNDDMGEENYPSGICSIQATFYDLVQHDVISLRASGILIGNNFLTAAHNLTNNELGINGYLKYENLYPVLESKIKCTNGVNVTVNLKKTKRYVDNEWALYQDYAYDIGVIQFSLWNKVELLGEKAIFPIFSKNHYWGKIRLPKDYEEGLDLIFQARLGKVKTYIGAAGPIEKGSFFVEPKLVKVESVRSNADPRTGACPKVRNSKEMLIARMKDSKVVRGDSGSALLVENPEKPREKIVIGILSGTAETHNHCAYFAPISSSIDWLHDKL